MYYKQIDGLRAIAVIAVIAHHWISNSFLFADAIHYGAYGVDLFFVISGFLITNILIQEKKNNKTSITNIKTFYIRRALRIFPIYYLYLFILFCFKWHEIQEYSFSLLTYLFNLKMYFTGWSTVPYIIHLWSLSVEEQFYLLWPVLLLFSSLKNSYRYIVILFFLSFILSSFFFFFTPYTELKLFTPYSFMSLCLGSILAFIKKDNIKIPYQNILLFSTLLVFICLKSSYIPHFPAKNIIGYLIPFPSILFCFFVWKAYEGYTGIGRIILENPLLIFIGKISYGLYLYHMIIPYVFFPNTTLLFVSANISILLLMAVLSYYLIEKPFNKLKTKFSYS